ncbi:hypothetical protein OC842_006362 [Tilletia horrida]|uniref:SH3 domain-containing protein n=1 Tax=Tilletia horrida TaxID=155126 RepID=A0AAN6G7E7_9BASI|nr:hypothetical protein OC842_006362 [Tilletia horrida]
MVAPLPADLPRECAKATKILSSFSPVDGLDKIVPISVLARAHGFALFSVVRVGFILSARAGSGIVIARVNTNPDGSGGHWTAPTAIGIAGLGGGFNAGAQIVDCLVVLNSPAAVRAFTTTGSLQLGGNLSVAVGPVGRSADASGSLNSKGSVAAMFSYARAKGLYGGISLEGTILVERTDANVAAYGKGATAATILSGRIDPPLWSRSLIDAIEKLTKTGHLADRLDRARQEEIDREYGAGLTLGGGRASYDARRKNSGLGDSSEDTSPSPGMASARKTRKERQESSSLWSEDDQDTLASLSRSSGRMTASAAAAATAAAAGAGASHSPRSSFSAARRGSAATGTLFDDDFSTASPSYSSPVRPGYPSSSSSKIKTRATPPPPLSMSGDYVFGSSAGGSMTNTPSTGRRTPGASGGGGRPPSSGGRRTPGGSMSLFSRASSRTPAATDDPYASYFDSNHQHGGEADSPGGALATTPGSAGSKRPAFLRHRTRSSTGSKRSFSLVPAAFRRDTPPVPGGSASLAEEELERKLRLYDEDNSGRAGSGMQRSYSASGVSPSTPAYAGIGRRKTPPAPTAFPSHFQQESSGMGFTSSEDEAFEAPNRTRGGRADLQDTYEEALARDVALARRPSPPSSTAWPRMGRSNARDIDDDDDDNDDLRRLEIIARRQRAILDAEERGESGRDSLDEFDRELQQERARLSSSTYARYGFGSGAGSGAGVGPNGGSSNLARTLLSRSGSLSGNAGNGTAARMSSGSALNGGAAATAAAMAAARSKQATGREDPFAELYASQTGASSSSPAAASLVHSSSSGTTGGGGGGGGLGGRRLSSVRSSGETSMFDSVGGGSSHAQSALTPASSVGGLPQLIEDGSVHGGVGPGAEAAGGLVLALFPFQAQMPTDLGFAKGDVIRVTKRTASREDWWEGINSAGASGSFPANYTSDL